IASVTFSQPERLPYDILHNRVMLRLHGRVTLVYGHQHKAYTIMSHVGNIVGVIRSGNRVRITCSLGKALTAAQVRPRMRPPNHYPPPEDEAIYETHHHHSRFDLGCRDHPRRVRRALSECAAVGSQADGTPEDRDCRYGR